MKLAWNIFLIAVVFCVSCSANEPKRTETQTTEEDGTVKTVITEEWEEERTEHHTGRGRGHGDTIIIMTNDNENEDHHHHHHHHSSSNEAPKPETSHGFIKEKTSLVNRLFKEAATDYHYSIDPQEQNTLIQSGFKPDGHIGHIFTRREDFPDCIHLVPINRLNHPATAAHGLVVTAGNTHQWLTVWGWTDMGVIGYGVLEQGQCGATVHVRHLAKDSHYQTSSDAEYNTFKSLGFVDHVAPPFYVWDESDRFTPPHRPSTTEDKTALLTRVYHEKLTDYDYTVDQEQVEVFARAGYPFDANMGYIVKKQSDITECPHLVPITKLNHPATNAHGLVVTAAHVRQWLTVWAWTDAGIIGYGVLVKGQCGANLAVRHIAKDTHMQTTSDAEYAQLKKQYIEFVDHVAPTFYIWSESDQFVPAQRVHTLDDKTVILTRLYKDQVTDYHYSVSSQEQKILGNAGYKFDAVMGRIVAKQSDLPNCPDLVPITRLNHAPSAAHGLVVNAANVNQWKTDWGWTDAEVIGYGVLTMGKCGASLSVRHLAKDTHFQTSSDAEYALYKKPYYEWVDHVAPTFYIWEA